MVQNSLFEMSLEELMDITVVSSSRQAVSQKMLSTPVTTVTGEDIHYSGATNIPGGIAVCPRR